MLPISIKFTRNSIIKNVSPFPEHFLKIQCITQGLTAKLHMENAFQEKSPLLVKEFPDLLLILYIRKICFSGILTDQRSTLKLAPQNITWYSKEWNLQIYSLLDFSI